MTCSQGTAEYNGITFGPYFSSQANAEDVLGGDGVHISHTKYTVTIEAILTDRFQGDQGYTNVDTWWDTVKEDLQKPRKRFVFKDQGLGDIDVNGATTGGEAGTKGDALNGPIPRIVKWEPIGNNKAVRLVWSITFHIYGCDMVDTPTFFPLEFHYTRVFRVDENGLLVLRTQGELRVKNLDQGDQVNNLSYEVTTRFNQNTLPGGFERGSTTFRYSADNMAVIFEFEDREIDSDNAFPFYVNRLRVEHRMRSTLMNQGGSFGTGGFKNWMNTVSGTINLRPHQPRERAWIAFIYILNQRLKRYSLVDEQDGGTNAFLKGPTNRAENDTTHQQNPFAILTELDIREPIYGRDFRFSASYFAVYSLDHLFKLSGMFHPVYGSDSSGSLTVKPWTTSFDAPNLNQEWTLWEARQNIETIKEGLGNRETQEQQVRILFDPCDHVSETTKPKIGNLQATTVTRSSSPSEQDDPTSYTPEPQKTWIDYYNRFEVNEIPRVATYPYQESVPIAEKTTGSSPADAQDSAQSGFRINSNTNSASSGTNQTITSNGKSVFEIVMRGYAVRAHYKIPTPVIVSVNNLTAYRYGKQFWTHEQIGFGDNPVYMAEWVLRYRVVGDIHNIDIMNAIRTNGFPAVATKGSV